MIVSLPVLSCRRQKNVFKSIHRQLINCFFSFVQGMLAVMDPATSWSAKWSHHRNHAPGCYALAVQAELPQNIVELLESHGVTVREDD